MASNGRGGRLLWLLMEEVAGYYDFKVKSLQKNEIIYVASMMCELEMDVIN